MNSAGDMHVLMQQPFAAEELKKWPLMHGTLCTSQELEQIRQQGLIADGVHSNSQDYDHELGRTDFVFLAPASFLGNYGFGSAVLVDCAVMERKDLRFSDQDVRVAIECLTILIEDGLDSYCGTAKNVERLWHMIAAQRARSSDADDKHVYSEIIRSAEFESYYREQYELSEVDFWHRIQTAHQGQSLFEYFKRTNDPCLQEEILVFKQVPPDLLLGYWDGSHWNEWRKATSDIQDRLHAWIDAATKWKQTAIRA